jgi:mRNA interferase MazF
MVMKRMPRCGEIWLVDFDPSVGAEVQKTRPAVVLNPDDLTRLPIRIVVPLTEWKSRYARYPWFMYIPATPANGLRKDSGADAFQIKAASEFRFTRWLGVMSASELDAIAAAVAVVVGKP